MQVTPACASRPTAQWWLLSTTDWAPRTPSTSARAWAPCRTGRWARGVRHGPRLANTGQARGQRASGMPCHTRCTRRVGLRVKELILRVRVCLSVAGREAVAELTAVARGDIWIDGCVAGSGGTRSIRTCWQGTVAGIADEVHGRFTHYGSILTRGIEVLFSWPCYLGSGTDPSTSGLRHSQTTRTETGPRFCQRYGALLQRCLLSQTCAAGSASLSLQLPSCTLTNEASSPGRYSHHVSLRFAETFPLAPGWCYPTICCLQFWARDAAPGPDCLLAAAGGLLNGWLYPNTCDESRHVACQWPVRNGPGPSQNIPSAPTRECLYIAPSHVIGALCRRIAGPSYLCVCLACLGRYATRLGAHGA